jgi:hypothetical protein
MAAPPIKNFSQCNSFADISSPRNKFKSAVYVHLTNDHALNTLLIERISRRGVPPLQLYYKALNIVLEGIKFYYYNHSE